MLFAKSKAFQAGLLVTSALGLVGAAHNVAAQTVDQATDQPNEVVVKMNKKARSSVELSGTEMQKTLPGISPLRAIQTLPGVSFQTADPWGNNEQNETLFVHGFSLQQLGYTFDNVPLGDQQYGNWNGLSVSRAVTSENVSRVILASGAGDLGTASTSNLGGTIETFSSDPSASFGVRLDETIGSYNTFRTFARLDTGTFGNGNSLYVSVLNHDAKAWDFKGHQKGNQLNAKFVRVADKSKFTVWFDYQKKFEPNEDSIVHVGNNPAPYTRPFLYNDYDGAVAYLNPTTGAPPAADGSNFRNYHSAAQREDYLAYVKYDYAFNDNLNWSNQVYLHHNYGRGIVAGPINQAGLPALFGVYYPGPVGETSAQQVARLKTIFGGAGYAVRTTEYLINRGGAISTLNWTAGDHEMEAGIWLEHQFSSQNRVWYPFSASSNNLTPYDIPTNKNFTQYQFHGRNSVAVLHLQDQWHITPKLLLQYGFKSSFQNAKGWFPINQKNLSTTPVANQTIYPTGKLKISKWFLPQIGLVYDVTKSEQVFLNAQKNIRQYINYGAGGSAWSQINQAAFDYFKANTPPESSWTYEGGLRSNRNVDFGPLTAFDAQLSLYHVDFSHRQLSISPNAAILSLVAGASIISDVGSVKTDGVDIAGTLHFGKHFSVYDAWSYTVSKYQEDYINNTTLIRTGGKKVPNSPEHLNKFVISTNWGNFDAQVSGDTVGRRYATYTNDLYVDGYTLYGLNASYKLGGFDGLHLKSAKIALSVTNLTDIEGTSTLVVGANSGTYNTYPIPPRMVFVNLSGKF